MPMTSTPNLGNPRGVQPVGTVKPIPLAGPPETLCRTPGCSGVSGRSRGDHLMDMAAATFTPEECDRIERGLTLITAVSVFGSAALLVIFWLVS